ncbi:YceI family protein [Asaia sp. HN010]|uniref:YceI family protein n=1 Tax=Asaia sp. HN010 TaxID=3081233 RepID=UPI003016CD0B
MHKTFLAGAALITALSAAAVPQAHAQQGGTPDPKAVQSGSYAVEPYHTQISFSLLHMGFSDFSGFFSQASGALTLDPSHIEATKLDVTLPINSVQTTVAKLDGELKGADWFDADKFPTAHFVSTKVVKTGAKTANIIGDLTLHGVTHPVTIKARLIGSGVNPLDKKETVGFEGNAVIMRSAFGVSRYVPLVGDSVTLHIAGAFERQS